MRVRGSCLCGGIRYEVDGPLGMVVHCHCSMCRKAPWLEITDGLPQFPEVFVGGDPAHERPAL
jgi:hypothetical protein